MKRSTLSLIICLASSAFGGNQAPSDSVKVTGDVAAPMRFTSESLAKFTPVKVKLRDHDGTVVTYEGVRVEDILKQAGVVAGEHPGKAVATYVAAVASDGYEVVFGLGELTQAITGRTIILAYSADGKPLGPNVGPFRIVIEGDKVQARCIRMVTELRVGRLRK